MNAVELIERKRDGQRLTEDEIRWLIQAYTDGTVTDYQMSAMAMAIYFNGLDAEELWAWTGAMLESGEVLDLSDIASTSRKSTSTRLAASATRSRYPSRPSSPPVGWPCR